MSEKLKNRAICEQCEAAVIAGTVQNDPVLAEHLRNCPVCREFADFQQTLLDMEPAVEKDLPEFAALMQKVHQQKIRSRRNMHFIVWPLSMAAAAAVIIGGFALQLPPEQTVKKSVGEYKLFEDPAALAAALEESTVLLAWDNASIGEKNCKNSMREARQGAENWSIEVFNPYSEEYIK